MLKFFLSILFFEFLFCTDNLKQARVSEYISTKTIDYISNLKKNGDSKEFLYDRQTIAYLERAKARFILDKLDESLDDFNIVINRSSNLYEAFFYRGQIYFLQESYEKSIDDFNYVIQNESFLPEVVGFKIQSQFHISRNDSIMVDINSFINYVESNHPFLGKIYFFKGAILYEKRDYFRSLEYLNYAIKKSPDLWEAYMLRGNIFRLQGDLDKALIDLNIAVESDLCPREVFLYRGLTHSTYKNFSESIDDITKFLILTPGYHQKKPEAILQRALSRYYNGDFNESINDLNEVLKRYPDHWLSYRLLGLVYLEKKNYKLALNNFNTAIEYGDNDIDIFLHRGISHINLFNYQNAKKDLSIFIDNTNNSHPNHSTALNKRGLAFFFMKEIDEACSDWTNSFIFKSDTETDNYIKRHCLN